MGHHVVVATPLLFDQHQEHDMGHHATIAPFLPMHLSPLPPQHFH